MLDHLLDIEITPIDVENAVYVPLKGASPSQVMSAKLKTAEHVAPVTPDTDPELSAFVARAAVEPFLVGADQQVMQEQVQLLETPSAVFHVRALLNQFDIDFLQNAGQIRNLVITKLLEATEDGRTSNRLKALEMLGKVTEVGLFTERVTHSVENLPEAELDRKIAEKMARFTGVTTLKPRSQAYNTPEDVESVVEEVFSEVNAKKKSRKNRG